MKVHQILIAVLAAILWGITVSGASAAERIQEFVSEIAVQDDGSLHVTETITVRAEGDQIKRGIFRDIPLRAKDASGWEHEVGFSLEAVRVDGQPAHHFEKYNGDGVRIYIGREDVLLEPGSYTYEIRYIMDRQVRFFDGYDEVYWNVTGNEWVFPIDQAVARIALPGGQEPSQFAAYTGGYGETGSAYGSDFDTASGKLVIETNALLDAGEGLTVAVGFPKGVIPEPSAGEKWQTWLKDQRLIVTGLLGLGAFWLYGLMTWFRVGRDPEKGVIFPRFKAPEGVSPALTNYIANQGFAGSGWIALSAACISLATKGYLTLRQEGKGALELELDRKAASDPAAGDLPGGEAAIVHKLSERGSPLKLTKANGETVSSLGSQFRSAIITEHKGAHFVENGWYIFGALIVMLAAGASMFLFNTFSEPQFVRSFLFGFLGIFVTAISFGLGKLALAIFGLKDNTPVSRFTFWIVFAAFLLSGLYGVAHLAALLTESRFSIPLLPIFLAGLIVSFGLYVRLIKAPTAAGRAVMDELDGLKLYLSVAEKERLNMAGAPQMDTVHFEKLLPYAVALGVEKPWTNSFETWLKSAAAGAAQRTYKPRWYRGDSDGSRMITRSISSTASKMAGSFHSALPVSNSSGSGSSGGGSSGGGGGGGGGGGW
ncbi:DUF2207 domain-containing protein [uncultured Roseibium sp.]|uniref:DUF2207 domain-containing protein n=1 Tax=uncultured Roseibium sp. TaxID=1936171 RepID=UPI002598AAA4|nr:DUF2207 domain-containing protein [uncultured Roseibium sp.]